MPENINHGVSLRLPPLALHGRPPAALRYVALAPRGPRHGQRRGRRGTERHSAALPADAAQESGAHLVRLQRVSWCKFDKKPQIVSNRQGKQMVSNSRVNIDLFMIIMISSCRGSALDAVMK